VLQIGRGLTDRGRLLRRVGPQRSGRRVLSASPHHSLLTRRCGFRCSIVCRLQRRCDGARPPAGRWSRSHGASEKMNSLQRAQRILPVATSGAQRFRSARCVPPYLARFACVQVLIGQSASSAMNPPLSGGIGLNGEAFATAGSSCVAILKKLLQMSRTALRESVVGAPGEVTQPASSTTTGQWSLRLSTSATEPGETRGTNSWLTNR
jgi:hypothetical protein